MFPQGTIWQAFRQRALTAIPVGCHVPPADPPTLLQWLNRGAITVTALTNKSFTIAASTEEVGAALFAEAAFLLDQASEHSVTVRSQLSAGKWYSAAWLGITFYYWAFFLVLSISRMLGRTGLFLPQEEAKKLQLLSASSGPAPGAGPYIFSCSPAGTVGHTNVVLQKAARSRVHDLVWRLLFDELRALLPTVRTRDPGAEERLYGALLDSSNFLGSTWPSDLRNLVNYAPGIGYGAVRKASKVGVFGTVALDPASKFDTILDRLEYNVSALKPPRNLLVHIGTTTRVLVDVTFALDVLARTLHSEIVQRHSLDQRWLNARREFLREQFRAYGEPGWPHLEAA